MVKNQFVFYFFYMENCGFRRQKSGLCRVLYNLAGQGHHVACVGVGMNLTPLANDSIHINDFDKLRCSSARLLQMDIVRKGVSHFTEQRLAANTVLCHGSKSCCHLCCSQQNANTHRHLKFISGKTTKLMYCMTVNCRVIQHERMSMVNF